MTRTRADVLREFDADELARLLPLVVAERVNALADRVLALEAENTTMREGIAQSAWRFAHAEHYAEENERLRTALADARQERDKFASDALGYALECGKAKTRAESAEREREAMRAVCDAAVRYVGAYDVPGGVDADGLSNWDRAHDHLLAAVRAYRESTAQPGGEDA